MVRPEPKEYVFLALHKYGESGLTLFKILPGWNLEFDNTSTTEDIEEIVDDAAVHYAAEFDLKYHPGPYYPDDLEHRRAPLADKNGVVCTGAYVLHIGADLVKMINTLNDAMPHNNADVWWGNTLEALGRLGTISCSFESLLIEFSTALLKAGIPLSIPYSEKIE